MKIEKVKVAVVGCGDISKVYMEAFTNRFEIIELVGCFDLDEARMKKSASEFNIKPMTFEEILEDKSIEMVVNLTNPVAHYPITKRALEHGKNVFSEKMLAVNLEDGKELCDIAKKKGLHLGCAPDTFLGGSIQTSKYIVDSGLIGTPLSVMASLNRSFDILGDIFPHLHKAGDGMPFDTGCYYMTALACILGPVSKVTAFSKINQPKRINRRIGSPNFGMEVNVESENILSAAIMYKNGVLGTLHLDSESCLDERPHMEIYGTEGILIMGDPTMFDKSVYVQKMFGDLIKFPFTHGYGEQSRGVGAAEMAWAIRNNRPHRASMEMAYHVFEQIHGMIISSKDEKVYHLNSEFEIPEPLKRGFIEKGPWSPTEEVALM